MVKAAKSGKCSSNSPISRPKLTEICLLLSTVKFDILAITETRLSCSVSDSEIAIDGYSVYRSDRNDGRKGGGTLFFYEDHTCM